MRTVIITILINRGIAGAVAVGAVDVYMGEVGAGMGAVGAGMGTGGAGGKCVVLQAKFRIQRYQIKASISESVMPYDQRWTQLFGERPHLLHGVY